MPTHHPMSKFGRAQARIIKGFERGTKVALKKDPSKYLGELVNKPGFNMKMAVVRLPNGSTEVLFVTQLVIWEEGNENV